MAKLFHDVPESLDNTQAIVDKIEVLNLKKDILLPASRFLKSSRHQKIVT